MVPFKVYTMGMLALHKHFNIARGSDKSKAIKGVRSLSYGGDPMKFQLDCLNVIRAVIKSKVTIFDFILDSLMHSFDGKGEETTQHEITKLIEQGEITQNNYHQIVEDLCSTLHMLKRNNIKGVNTTTTMKCCSRCGRMDGHTHKNCAFTTSSKGKPITSPPTVKSKKPPPVHHQTPCSRCGRHNHLTQECRAKFHKCKWKSA